MALIKWREEFSVGNASIDLEHEHMIGQINELYDQLGHDVDAVTIEAMLGDIQADISAHFALEELLMREAGYAEYEDHKEDHEDLLDQIHDLVALGIGQRCELDAHARVDVVEVSRAIGIDPAHHPLDLQRRLVRREIETQIQSCPYELGLSRLQKDPQRGDVRRLGEQKRVV